MKTTKTTNTNSTKVLPNNNNKKKSKLPEDVQKLLEDWEEFEKKFRKEEETRDQGFET